MAPARNPLPASFVYRHLHSWYFTAGAWRTKKLVEALSDAVRKTALSAHLPLLGVDDDPAVPRGTSATLRGAFARAEERVTLVAGSRDRFDDSATGFLDVEYGVDSIQVTCMARAPLVTEIGIALVDDLFRTACAALDGIADTGFLLGGYAWVEWEASPPETNDLPGWLTRAVADLVQDGAPVSEEDPAVSAVASAIARARVPRGVKQRTHSGLLMNQWVTDLRDADVAGRAQARHAAWIAKLAAPRERRLPKRRRG